MIRIGLRRNLHLPGGPTDLSVEIEIRDGEMVTLFGGSGAGKTTLLRTIAGLTRPDAGRITVNGDVWYDGERGIHLPPQKREIGFVFQDYALFPKMSVRENLEFALDRHGEKAWIEELLALVKMAEFATRRPESLSGGQRQRVALARALVRRPRILLLDEPFSALDAETRFELQEAVLRLHRQSGATTLLVSHDLSEIYKLANRVLVIEAGRIIRSGTPSEVFSEGKTSGKFTFAGEVVAIEKDEVVHILTVRVGNNLVKVVASGQEADGLAIGSKILVSSKAFNPILMRI